MAIGVTGGRFGLRGQLLFALAMLFVLSFSLLATAAVQLTRRSQSLEHKRQTERVARLLSLLIADPTLDETPYDPERVRALLVRARGELHLPALAFEPKVGPSIALGAPPPTSAVRVGLPDGGVLRLWSRPVDELGAAPALGQLLIFYVALTAGAVLLFAFVLLTFLIVRPLEAVTLSSERLAAGDLSVRVPVSGAAEVVRLSTSFNRMAAQLRQDREDLEARLAELERTAGELRTTQAQLVHGEKLASVGRLSAGIAHEIGNPLAAILGLVELLQSGALTGAQNEEFLGRIHGETERINGIIRNLLDFSRREPIAEARRQAVDLREVVSDAIELVRPQKATRRVSLEAELPSDLPRVSGTASELTQVIVNLLLNAVDALQGDGQVSLSATRVDADSVELCVRDNGPGIAAEVVDHLFEPFTTTKPVGHGTGLGLAVAHGLVERMGGRLSVDPPDGAGACFRICLRVAR